MASKRKSELQVLDVANNKLGYHESASSTIIPCCYSISEFLSSEICSLTSLFIGWNMIRLKSALSLATCISSNQSSTLLDLSYNGVGSEAGIMLGSALLDNKNLKSLNLTNNELDAPAIIAICQGIVIVVVMVMVMVMVIFT